MAQNKAQTDKSPLTFEQALTQLKQIVQKLEQGDCPLDETLSLYEQGTNLIKFCNQTLKTAEARIAKVVDENNNLTDFKA